MALNSLVGLYTAWGKPGDASRYREMLAAISVEKMRDVGRVQSAPPARRRNGGQSATVGGRQVWVFQDTTMLGFDDAGQRKIDTSWGVVDPAKGTDLPTVTVTNRLGRRARGPPPVDRRRRQAGRITSRCQPFCGIGARDRTLVFYTKAQKDAQRAQGASSRDVDRALVSCRRARSPAAAPPRVRRADTPVRRQRAALGLRGHSRSETGSTCTAARRVPRDLNVRCRLARVPPDRALDRAEWRFYTGSSWSADWRAAKPVLDRAFKQMSVTWNDYLGKYVAVNTRLLSSELSIRTADRPEGPWSEEIIVEGLTPPAGFPWIHQSFVHPELERDGGRIQIVTYARSIGIAGVEMRAMEIEFRKR